MQIAAAVAKPEQKLHIFVGTWNVGNARPVCIPSLLFVNVVFCFKIQVVVQVRKECMA